MSKYKVLKTLSYSGDSFKPGDVVEMDDESARAFGADYVEHTSAPAAAGDGTSSDGSVQTEESDEHEEENQNENH